MQKPDEQQRGSCPSSNLGWRMNATFLKATIIIDSVKFAKSLVILSVAILIAATFFYFTREDLTSIGDTTFVLVSLIAAILLWITAFRIKFEDERAVWRRMAIATTFDFLGEAYWAYYEIFKGIELPSPSIADIFWITSYLIFIFALWAQLKIMFAPTRKLIAGLTVGLLALLAITYLFVKDIAIQGITFSTLIDFIYPYIDVVHITLVILILIPLWRIHSKLSTPWLLLCTSYLAFITYDFTYAYLRVFAEYYTGATIDLIYALGYILLGIAGYTKLTSTEVQSATRTTRNR
ncbi:Uncharacterised protein [uncultured archaeon]|nr:Uncharacterised protein [uncultured archaeon]